ncbi:MAG: hypothetical protein KF861_12615, partial [Planctomycetaceae bacterium]|nr:hypothetical protein [Planctomycetaceae bacterium]
AESRDADGERDGRIASSAAVDWQRLASMEMLNEEVKRIRNRLTAHLRTVASFNREGDAIANDAVVLAAIAAVAARHPESTTWQQHADAVRDLATQLASHAGRTGRESFTAAQLPYEQLLAILDGGRPTTVGAANVPFSDVADRSSLMKRIKRSFDFLKGDIASETRFRQSEDDILREATLLATLGGMISTDSYGSWNEPRYQQFVSEFIESSLLIRDAAVKHQFSDFLTARDRLQNSCAACHGEYALGDEGL